MATTGEGVSYAASSIPLVRKYPRTEHLLDTGGSATTPDDLVVSDLNAIFQAFCHNERPVIVEEKVDGANLGFRVSDEQILVQNRSRYISSGDHAQFSRIQSWVEEHRESLLKVLGSEQLILYGEWCVAKHSLPYDRLPDYFVAFDLFDLETERFYSRARFHRALRGSGIPVVPTIGVQTFSNKNASTPLVRKKTSKARKSKIRGRQNDDQDFTNLVLPLLERPSAFRKDQGLVEGVMLRQDSKDWLVRRVKVVRPDFIRGCTQGHWSRRPIEKQVVDYVFAQDYLKECYVFADETVEISEDAPSNSGHSQDKLEAPNRNLNNVPLKRSVTKSKSRKEHNSVSDTEKKKNIKARRRRIPRCIMLMGLPASGKSTFAQRLAQALNQENSSSCSKSGSSMMTLIANQDDLGRQECLGVASRASGKIRVIVDRCNLTEAERREWLECMHSPPASDVVLIYCAASVESCTQRVKLRLGHPTLAPGKGGVCIVEQLAARIEPPTEMERKRVFGRIETLRTWEEATALLYEWGVVVEATEDNNDDDDQSS